jgi:hypothetical protein
MDDSRGSTFSALQHLLKLSYSEDPDEQQKASIALARAVEGTAFPAVSFGPLAHALCRLVPSPNRTVASYSAKALKSLLLDDSLRPQAIVAGVPAIVCLSIKRWEDEVLCLRELLGSLQTLCWDKQCLKAVLQADIVTYLTDFAQATDQEVSVLSLATLANILSYADTLLLSDNVVLEALGEGMPTLLDTMRQAAQRPQRFYAAAAVANAAAHPRLCGVLNQNGGLQVCREVERHSLANLHILGSRMSDCARTAIYHLSDRREGELKMGAMKYRFKWGTKPIMELSLASYKKHSAALWCCFVIWVLMILYTFAPLIHL